MIRVSILLCLGVFAAACSAVPGTSPGANNPLASPAGEALGQVCDASSNISISSVAQQLRSVDGTSDASAIESSLDTLITNLEATEVGTGATTLKDTALTQLRLVETALADPTTASESASAAADALEGLGSAVC